MSATVEIESIDTQFPVVIRQVHPPNSPADSFSVLLSPTNVNEPPNEHAVFRLEDGKVVATSADSFIYMAGNRPGAKTDNADVGADSTVVLVHIRPNLERVYVLKFDNPDNKNESVTVKPRQGNAEQRTITQAVQYVDVLIDDNGVYEITKPEDVPEASEDDPDYIRGFAVDAIDIAVQQGFDPIQIP